MRDVSFSKATSPIIIFQIAIHFELLQADLISLLVVPGSILPPFPQESQMQVKSAQAKVEYKKLHQDYMNGKISKEKFDSWKSDMLAYYKDSRLDNEADSKTE